ncbi:MAG: hypothetical protein U9O95_07230 [Candidatus Marinimicrobia bacterium]|nr:hypothetical protein [Candidatus Neomarinimicrobiota bacterium]
MNLRNTEGNGRDYPLIQKIFLLYTGFMQLSKFFIFLLFFACPKKRRKRKTTAALPSADGL